MTDAAKKRLGEEIHTTSHEASKNICPPVQSDHIIPSIEVDPTPCINILSDDEEDNDQTLIFIPQGVLVGFWSVNPAGEGRKPVYCLINEAFEFAYLKHGALNLVRWCDFDPLDIFGDWMGDDTESVNDTGMMSPKEIQEWVMTMWYSRDYCGIETLGDYYEF